MPEEDIPLTPATPTITDSLKSWTMAIITLIFVILYAGTFTGSITVPQAVQNLQPIVYVIIGYYFGRLPSQQVETSLKTQVTDQTNNATAARLAEKKAEIDRETLEEKMKNARSILEKANSGAVAGSLEINAGSGLVDAAIKVLSS